MFTLTQIHFENIDLSLLYLLGVDIDNTNYCKINTCYDKVEQQRNYVRTLSQEEQQERRKRLNLLNIVSAKRRLAEMTEEDKEIFLKKKREYAFNYNKNYRQNLSDEKKNELRLRKNQSKRERRKAKRNET